MTTLWLPVAGQILVSHCQCRTVGPAGVTVDTTQPDRTFGKGGIQIRPAWKFLYFPVILIPASSQQPVSIRQVLLLLTQALDNFRLTAGSAQLGLAETDCQPVKMGM